MRNQAGQSLVESLIAITIIVVGVISLIALLMQARVSGDISKYEGIAMQLGSEAIEGARYIRDSNWLAIENGDPTKEYYTDLRTNLATSVYYNSVYMWDPAAVSMGPPISLGFVTSHSGIDSVESRIYQDASGYYRQSNDPLEPAAEGWVETNMKRWVTTYPVCFDDSASDEYILNNDLEYCTDADPSDQEIGIQIVVHMQWEDRGNTYDRRKNL